MPFLPATDEIITIRPFGPFKRSIDTEQRPERLGGDDGTGHVDVHLAAKLINRQVEHGPGDRDPGIVDEAKQRLAIECSADIAGGGEHRRFVRDVEQQRGEIGAELALQPVGIGLLADAAEHTIALVQQEFGAGMPDAGGRAGDDD